ncbi:hypothetical protein IJ798_00995 [Candidatus Saccharibacteria bacterium]|nr:hypothetical protein [Candidatus Saccharibacteria bacterium]
MEAWGAQGSNEGGKAGYVAGTTSVSKNSTLRIYVGSQNNHFNGGGYSPLIDGECLEESYNGAEEEIVYANQCTATKYPGGDGTDIRTVANLSSRILVAAGGGAKAFDDMGNYFGEGHGGGLYGYDGYHFYTGGGCTPNNCFGLGASQTAGGSPVKADYFCLVINSAGKFGVGGTNYPRCGTIETSGGGGGGWYGGSGATYGGSGGGSSYISGHAGSIAVTSSSSPKCSAGSVSIACSQSWTGYTFINTVMIDGAGYKWTTSKQGLQQMPNPNGGYYASGVGHSGNGYAKITYLGPTV